MNWPVTANPERFTEAMEWFDSRVPMDVAARDELTESQKSHAFTVAGVLQLSMVSTVLDGMTKAIADGESIDSWRKSMKSQLKRDWTRAESAVLDTTFITNTQTAYNAGRYRQLTDPDVKRLRPFWIFDAVLDSATTHICRTLDELTLPADDPQWGGNYPPMHHRCRSGIRSVTKRSADRRGGVTEEIPEPKVPKGFGKLPTAAPWKPSKADYPADAWSEYQKKQRAMRKG